MTKRTLIIMFYDSNFPKELTEAYHFVKLKETRLIYGSKLFAFKWTLRHNGKQNICNIFGNPYQKPQLTAINTPQKKLLQ